MLSHTLLKAGRPLAATKGAGQARCFTCPARHCQHRRPSKPTAATTPLIRAMTTDTARSLLKESTIPPFDALVDKAWKQAFPVELMKRRQFERPLEWGLAEWSFSNHNEDCAAELAVVQALLQRDGAKPMRVMCVASAGETATALAAMDGVQECVGVDMVNGQVLLTQLRFAAMLHLSNDDYKALFALDIDSEEQRAATEQSRVEIYEKLREKLPADVRDVFDGLKDKDIAFGLGLSGKAEQWTNVCHRMALTATKNIGLYERDFWHGFRDGDVFIKYVNFPAQWMDSIKHIINFTNYIAGVDRLGKKYLEEAKLAVNGGSNNSADDEELVALAADKLRRNHYLMLFHTGAVGCGADVPGCYSPDVQNKLQDRVASGAIKYQAMQGDIIKSAIADVAAGVEPPLSFITVSNIFDFAPTPEAAMAQLAPLANGLVSGTHVLVRTTLTWRCSAEEIIKGAGLLLDEALTTIARAAERAPMFGNVGAIAVGVVPAKAA